MIQDLVLKQPDETCWSSYYQAVVNLIFMYSSIVEVIEIIKKSPNAKKRRGSFDHISFNVNF